MLTEYASCVTLFLKFLGKDPGQFLREGKNMISGANNFSKWGQISF
jgi:hypothetical protein